MSSDNETAKICQFLKLLLNDEVLCLTLSDLPMDRKHEMKYVTNTLFTVASECPNLRKLVCGVDPFDDDKLEFCDMVQVLICTLRFVWLQELDIEGMECNDVSLAILAHHLPQLR